jgi:hypothetical protein
VKSWYDQRKSTILWHNTRVKDVSLELTKVNSRAYRRKWFRKIYFLFDAMW